MQSPTFDESAYLEANPGLQDALRDGLIESGLQHFTHFGRNEQRPLMTRGTWLRRGLDLSAMSGLEIGALSRPTISKAEANIQYVDYDTREHLYEKYAADPDVVVEDLVDVDFIWTGGSLRKVLGDIGVDFIIASHVAEHVPNLLGWLSALREALTPQGRIRLVIPDRRFTFDLLRSETSLAELLDASVNECLTPTTRQILDFMLNGRVVDCVAAWDGTLVPDSLARVASPEHALHTARVIAASGDYLDTHCWVFTPSSFVELMADAARLGLLGLRCVQLMQTHRNGLEFCVELTRSDDQDEIVNSWCP